MATVTLGPAVVDVFGVRAGDRNVIAVVLKSGGVPWDLTGQTVTSQVRQKAGDIGAPAVEAVVTVTDGPNGKCSVQWPGADVAALLGTNASWSGVWDLQVAPATGDPTTVCAGKWNCEQDITRP